MLDNKDNERQQQEERLRQVQSMAATLKSFRQQQELEKSEFAAEFGRLSRRDSRLAAFGLLESPSLTALLAGCEAALQGADLELLWLVDRGRSWAAACLMGDAADLERALPQAEAAARRLEEPLLNHLFREPPLALRRWLLLHQLHQGEAWEKGDDMALGKSGDEVRRQLASRTRLQNAASLLEYTDAELRDLILRHSPEAESSLAARLNSMHKEELVDYYTRIISAPPVN